MPCTTVSFQGLGVRVYVLPIEENRIANTISIDKATLSGSRRRQRLLSNKQHRHSGTDLHKDRRDELVIHNTVDPCRTTNGLQYLLRRYCYKNNDQNFHPSSSTPHHFISRCRIRQKCQLSLTFAIFLGNELYMYNYIAGKYKRNNERGSGG